MINIFFADQFNQTIQQSSNILKQTTDTLFNAHTLTILVIAIVVAFVLGRLLAIISHRITRALARRADKAKSIDAVNKLRRTETLIVLSTALIRVFLIIFALYLWWSLTHPNQQAGAIIGASALFAIILGGVLSPLLRDLSSGSVMMAEHWFGVSDHVTIEPFTLQGIVERVTLRSVKIRSLNGESIWVNNQAISAVKITPKGVSTMAIEIFVNNLNRGLDLIEETNLRLPNGPLMVISPLTVMTHTEAGDKLWHLTAIGETAPERQWLLEKYAIQIMQEIDEKTKHPTLLHEPIARYSDSDAERRFARTINTARKEKAPSRRERIKNRAAKQSKN
ncbi:MAG TPA: mechanosensitive ion channel domain-containing protein [Candidatus Saccharimonadales bacterium]|nr:mechanosensitive ion channel domain-containing protein [Candidatus Saccharimonadales bacterium]